MSIRSLTNPAIPEWKRKVIHVLYYWASWARSEKTKFVSVNSANYLFKYMQYGEAIKSSPYYYEDDPSPLCAMVERALLGMDKENQDIISMKFLYLSMNNVAAKRLKVSESEYRSRVEGVLFYLEGYFNAYYDSVEQVALKDLINEWWLELGKTDNLNYINKTVS